MSEIKKDIHWVGSIDWDLRNFHGYSTPHGSTYNAYLIIDQQPTLIDTVKHYGFDEMLGRIREIIDPAKIRYIISNHTEMDHSGSIYKLLKYCPSAEVVCSPKGEQGLSKHFLGGNTSAGKFKVVNTGDTLNIGKRNLSFLLMPMVHWPDSMATYSLSDKILFPNDAFGQHYACHQRFFDEIGFDFAMKEAAKYYGNIVMPYGEQVLKALGVASKFEFDMICPSHGLIYRRKQDVDAIIKKYIQWANYIPSKKAVIVYDTMWHSTETMAKKLYQMIDAAGVDVAIHSLATTDISDVITDVLEAKAVLVGTPMLNNNVLPSMAKFLVYLRGLKFKNRTGFTFGSYGWSTIGFKFLEDCLQESGMNLGAKGKYVQWVPTPSDLEQLTDMADSVSGLMKG